MKTSALRRSVLALCFSTIFLGNSFFESSANPLPRVSPEDEEASSTALLKYVDELDRIEGVHSVMVLRRGSVITEGWWAPYRPENRHTMYSLSKSFASTGIGLAREDRKLSIDDPVISFFPELTPTNASANLKSMRVRDLLSMSTGHHAEDIAKFDYQAEDAVKQFLALPVAHKPGTHFVYNTPASFMLSAIVQKATRENLLEYLKPRLFEPLGIEDAKWDAGRSGISLGGFGLHLRTEDVAKFGELYRREGIWNGREVLPRFWVSAATTRQTSNGSDPKSDWDQGYGYQFWRCRNAAYRGDGAFGQFCVVLPTRDAVLAITAGVRDMQQVLDTTWNYLLPALRPKGSGPTKDEAAQNRLQQKLASLHLRGVKGSEKSSTTAEVAGNRFKLAGNSQQLEEISVEQTDQFTILKARLNGKDYRIECAPEKWRDGSFAWSGISPLEANREEPASASGAWNGSVFTAKVAFIETPYILTLKLDFRKDQVTVDPEFNVAFGPTQRPQLIGTRSTE